jgi:uncharacterized membrane protein YgdD (TMEM256/DUF423 family)
LVIRSHATVMIHCMFSKKKKKKKVVIELFFVFLLLCLFESFVLYFETLVKLLDNITLFTLVLLRPIGGVIFWYVWFLLLYFTHCPFVTQRGSNFYFWTGIVFLTGQVIFVPEWSNGEFVSL